MHIDLTLSDPSLPNVASTPTLGQYVTAMERSTGSPAKIIHGSGSLMLTFTNPELTIVEVIAPKDDQTVKIEHMAVNGKAIADDGINDTAFTLLMAGAGPHSAHPAPSRVDSSAMTAASPVDEQKLMSSVKMAADDSGFYAVMPDFGEGHICDDVIRAEPHYFEPGVESALLSKLAKVSSNAKCEIAADIVFGVDKEWAKNTDAKDVAASQQRAHDLLDKIYSAQ
ncbi:hypothetical protein GCM10011408_40030 [Dyella caseinilytica]|nr:hypothetical protein GCM10011408_40030 [Dyella caseinilytica]